MIFENAKNPSKQGDIGEAKAIYEYTRLGFTVCRTLFDSAKYDLVVDDGENLLKVQVKTTKYKTKSKNYCVDLRSSGGNKSRFINKNRSDDDYDLLFALAENGDCWSIPVDKISYSTVNLGTKYIQFKL